MKRRGKIGAALGFLALIYFLVIFAGFFAPYSFDSQDREHPYAPPSHLHFVDADGRFHLRPFIYAVEPRPDALNEYVEVTRSRYPIGFFLRGERYVVLGAFRGNLHLFGVDGPVRFYVLGTDGFGRDQLSRILYGGQVSLFAGFLAALLCVAIGFLVGGTAGYYGGATDEVAMRLAEISLALPWFYLLVAVRAFLPLQMNPAVAFVLVIAVIGAVGWGRPARLVRGVVLSAKERGFVLAARGFGASDLYLLRRHILPQTAGVLLTQMALLTPQFILAEVTLSFLGLGMGEPFPSWGTMLAQAQQYHVLVSYWWMLLPGLVPVPIFLAYHLLADGLHKRLQFLKSDST